MINSRTQYKFIFAVQSSCFTFTPPCFLSVSWSPQGAAEFLWVWHSGAALTSLPFGCGPVHPPQACQAHIHTQTCKKPLAEPIWTLYIFFPCSVPFYLTVFISSFFSPYIFLLAYSFSVNSINFSSKPCFLLLICPPPPPPPPPHTPRWGA